MALTIDTSNEFGQRVLSRLNTEQSIWLVTVNGRNEPTPTLVWFLIEGDGTSALMFSEPHVGKVKSIRNNPNVALNFNSDPYGDNMIILNGTAELLDQPSSAVCPDAYVEKYKEGMVSLKLTRDQMLAQYSQPIRITFDRLRGH
ncbi:MAG: pyridoxamine 5'-phosphate oxidase family protein [Thermomicrobiales bacterium]